MSWIITVEELQLDESTLSGLVGFAESKFLNRHSGRPATGRYRRVAATRRDRPGVAGRG